MNNEIVTHQSNAIAAREELSVEDMVAQVQKIQKVMNELMHEGEHYGVIPGTERKDKDGKDISKRSLYKPGAEKLCLMFRLDPQYEVKRERDGAHLDVLSTCTLWHIPSGQRVASGIGSCSTREAKYAYRKSGRVCPECGEAAIIAGRAEFGGGWLCFGKKGGCGAKWPIGAPEIESQEMGRVANPDLADQYNTVVKMAAKRSLVAAVLNATAASDIFTQDLDDPDDDNPEEAARREARANELAKKTKPADPGADAIAEARGQALAQLYERKFGRGERTDRLRAASDLLKREIASFKSVTEKEFQTLMAEWNREPDAEDLKKTAGRVDPKNANPDGDLPFLSIAEGVRDMAISLEAWVNGKGVRISPKTAAALEIEEGVASLGDLEAIGKLNMLHALLKEAMAQKRTKKAAVTA